IAVEDVADGEVPAASVADLFLNAFAKVGDAKDNLLNALTTEPFDLMFDERATADIDEGLRNGFGHRFQTGREPARQNRDRQAHANSTFVPSKSNRNRTSWSPALLIADRRRR